MRIVVALKVKPDGRPDSVKVGNEPDSTVTTAAAFVAATATPRVKRRVMKSSDSTR